jgi:hypothetical protein
MSSSNGSPHDDGSDRLASKPSVHRRALRVSPYRKGLADDSDHDVSLANQYETTREGLWNPMP